MFHSMGFLPWFWVAVTVICIIIETVSLSLTTIWFACGALVTVLLSLTGIPFYVQLLIFVAVSLVLLLCTRPIVVKKIATKHIATNSDAIIGTTALVTEDIGAQKKGTIKAGSLVWSAKSLDGSEIKAGSECVVTAIEGVTAIVKKANSVS